MKLSEECVKFYELHFETTFVSSYERSNFFYFVSEMYDIKINNKLKYANVEWNYFLV